MYNIKLVIAYDGHHYFGWQKTAEGPSIEESLQVAIEQIVQHPIILQAASRTDAGVHAQGQVVNFLTSHSSLHMSRFQFSLNRLLPNDIAVLSIEKMPLTFHPTLDCQGKEYRYYICCGPKQLPFHRFYSWHVPYALSIEAIQQALPDLVGSHDFRAFCNVRKNRDYGDYVRDIQSLELISIDSQRFFFRIQGNHFLYKMVRNLVGTLIQIGRGRFTRADLKAILHSKCRTQAGISAPAHGLFLHQLFYTAV